ncbi:enoyl-CoA hydratase [Rhizobiales bacterium]|uniref:enoyl-CoA hydratase n=1 Tax=Ensifer sp. R-19 TaxID=3404055 RepID=UPI000DD519F0
MGDIVTERSEGILRVALNRPAKKNAMTSSMYLDLAGIFNEAAKDESVRVVLWHGAGDAFTAGNDIGDFLGNPPEAGGSPQSKLMHMLLEFDKPLIAAVRGIAVGGGTTMLLHCDFVYASENTRFQLPFINLALLPEFGSSYLLPLTVGHARAAELILLGLPFDAGRAQEMGLVTKIVPDPDVLQVAMETAHKLATKPSDALRAAKRLLKRPFRDQVRGAMDAENGAFSLQTRSEEAKEAFAAFLEKRPPDFSRAMKSMTAR